MSNSTSKPGKRRAETSGRGKSLGGMAVESSNRLRNVAASAIWVAAVLCALTLAVGALLIALNFNRDNAIVNLITQAADTIDFGEFKQFEAGKSKASQESALVKSVMVNWGIAAIIYLVIGKVADRLLRPKK